MEIVEPLPVGLPRDVSERLPFSWQAKFSVKQTKRKTQKELREIELTEEWDDLDRHPLNPGLILDKYLPRLEKLGEINGKGHLLLGIARYFDQHRTRYQKLFEAWWERQSMLLEALKARHHGAESDTVPATVIWRMVVGMGRPHVWENALALHPVYGFPYIPGSSVKGLVRLAAFWEIADALSLKPGERQEGADETWLYCLDRYLATTTDQSDWQAKFRNFNDSVFTTIRIAQALFGTVGRKGRGIFLDTLPEAFPKIEADIMNPHFQKYYQQGPKDTQPPSDDLQPNPIFFLTIGKETIFRFPLAILPPRSQGGPDSSQLLAQAKSWLKKAVEEFGVGAKTRAGYGDLKIA